MKKLTLVATTVLGVALMAGSLRAQGIHTGEASGVGDAAHSSAGATTDVPRTSNLSGSTASGTSIDTWRYRWNNDRWWYWTPEKKWVVWNGTTWVPFEQTNCGGTNVGRRVTPYVTNYGSYERQNTGGFASPAPRRGGSWSSSRTYPSSGYAGYGWTWGPGTAFRDGPGK